MVETATDTRNQLGSTSPEPLGSDEDYLPYIKSCTRSEFYLIYPLARFKAVIVDKGVKQVGYYCNDPIPMDVGALRCGLEGFASELTYRQNRYATLTGVQDVFQIYEISSYGFYRYVGESVLTYCHSLGKLIIQSQRTTVSFGHAYISIFYDSVDKIKVLTHCFEKSEGWFRRQGRGRTAEVHLCPGEVVNLNVKHLGGCERFTHTKIKCWEVSRVSGITAKLEIRPIREDEREERASALCVFVRMTGHEKHSANKFILFILERRRTPSSGVGHRSRAKLTCPFPFSTIPFP